VRLLLGDHPGIERSGVGVVVDLVQAVGPVRILERDRSGLNARIGHGEMPLCIALGD
jgi:hypothetical protein